MKPHRKSPLKVPPSEDDVWLDALHTECARAVAQALKGSVNLDRQIKTLRLPELKVLAAACEAAWLRTVAARLREEPASFSQAEADAYAALLM